MINCASKNTMAQYFCKVPLEKNTMNTALFFQWQVHRASHWKIWGGAMKNSLLSLEFFSQVSWTTNKILILEDFKDWYKMKKIVQSYGLAKLCRMSFNDFARCIHIMYFGFINVLSCHRFSFAWIYFLPVVLLIPTTVHSRSIY